MKLIRWHGYARRVALGFVGVGVVAAAIICLLAFLNFLEWLAHQCAIHL